jgi:hypothetical protein
MAEVSEDVLEAVAFVTIVFLVLLAIAWSILPKNFAGTSAGAYAAASGISYSLSGLSLADQGTITRYLNGTYDVEIGLEHDSDAALKNYYVILTPYTKDGRKLSPSDKIVFVGNVKIADKPVKLEKADYVKMAKVQGKPVEIAKIDETHYTETFCHEPTSEQIKEFISRYAPNAEEQKWVKALIMAESSYLHCRGSVAGAYGLMQLIDSTARSVGVSDRFDPEQNVKGGTTYLRSLVAAFKEYDDKYVLAVANYNCGKIGTLVSQTCEAKAVRTDCWGQEIRQLTVSAECQGAAGLETCRHVKKVQTCVKYYETNPNCFNAPGRTTECPKSDDCGNWDKMTSC